MDVYSIFIVGLYRPLEARKITLSLSLSLALALALSLTHSLGGASATQPPFEGSELAKGRSHAATRSLSGIPVT